jgi:hypothetical protein
MAIIRDDNEFKNKNVVPGGGSSQLGGGYSSGGGSSTGPAAGNVPQSSWTNIQEYLGDPSQGAAIANKVAGDVETQGMDVQKGIQGWESDVGNQITGTTPQLGDTAYNDVASGKSTAAPGTYAGAGGITDPTTTPGYLGLQKGATDVTEKANQLGSFSGIQTLLQKNNQQPGQQYSGRYDALLAQGGGSGRLGETQAKYGQTGKQLQTATSNLGTAIQGAQDKSALVNKSWEDATAANTARLSTQAQEDALKNLNADIAKRYAPPPVADMTKVNQDIAAQNNANAFYAQQKAAADAAAAAAAAEKKKKTQGDHSVNPLKAAGGSISSEWKRVTGRK